MRLITIATVAALCVGGCASSSHTTAAPVVARDTTTSFVAAGRLPIGGGRYVAPPPSSTTRCVSTNGLPDPRCTPGATDPRVTQANIGSTICVVGYTKTVRPPTSVTTPIKRERLRAYGDSGPLSQYELDHLIPLEIGGAPADVANLWPEPLSGGEGARSKDSVENALHRSVCNGTISLAAAQRAIAVDWHTAEK